MNLKLKRLSIKKRDTLYFFLFISPWIICFLLFGIYPICASVVYSFTKYDLTGSLKWIGLKNFKFLFADEVFWKAMKNTFVFSFIKMPLATLLSFLAALLLSKNRRGVGILRTLFYLPNVVPAAASILVWAFIFDSGDGLMNNLMKLFNFPPLSNVMKALFGSDLPIGWFNENNVMGTLIFMSLWGIGSNMLIFIAGIQGVPQVYYEAMEVDGASKWNQFIHITLPMISPVLLYVGLMGLVASLQVYAEMYLVTGGGPNNASISLVYLVYSYTFSVPMRVGLASALSWVVCILTILLSVLVFKVSNRHVFYKGD